MQNVPIQNAQARNKISLGVVSENLDTILRRSSIRIVSYLLIYDYNIIEAYGFTVKRVEASLTLICLRSVETPVEVLRSLFFIGQDFPRLLRSRWTSLSLTNWGREPLSGIWHIATTSKREEDLQYGF